MATAGAGSTTVRRPGAVIVGATHGVGRAIAEQLAAQGWNLVIAARSGAELDVVAKELSTAHDVDIAAVAVDIAADDASVRDFLTAVERVMPDPAALVIPAGQVAERDEATSDWETTAALIATNLTGPMRIAGHYVELFERRGEGTIVLLSSIAAGAPRRRNVAYAAAKSGLESFGRSLQHRLARSGAAVQIYRLGYVDTRLARREDVRLRPADPNRVAQRIVAGLGGRSKTVYEPRYWSVLIRVLRALPRPLYNRLDF